MKKILAIVLAISLLSFGSVLAQGPPEDAGPPDHAGPSRETVDEEKEKVTDEVYDEEEEKVTDEVYEEEKRVGPPEHAGEPGPPEHAGEQGPPEHSNAPDAVREMVQARVSGEKESGPPAFAGIPRFLRDSLLEDEKDEEEEEEKVADEVYAVEFEEENELEDVEIAVFDDDEEEIGEEFTTDEDGIAGKELENGEYSFEANLEDYKVYEGEFEVDGEDKIVEFEMEELESAYFEISGSSIGYGEDNEIDVTADIENTGDLEGEQEVTAVLVWEDEEVEGELNESKTISLDGQEKEEVEFIFEVVEDAESAEITLETEDDSTTREVNVD
ncbi:collagen-like triple helix repeat-containing protein [Natranaerofaba carboxydovora]|uniref:collagen-like triple helix repeat-containing protein n=1 Tax=Natranaerofaba carboxydovora TaxID=2742683 RepID=UPI001F13B959|nr:collagen-like protein [Natranaerofaba carboxydovora]UMZ74694.1 hypothetical protein ACONDI_02294 [Natranaerofaba carboxydovora]